MFYQQVQQKKFYKDVLLNVDDAPTYVCIDLSGLALLDRVHAPHISVVYKCKFSVRALTLIMEFLGSFSCVCHLAVWTRRSWHWKVAGSMAEVCHILVHIIQRLCHSDFELSSYSDDFHVTWN